MKPGVKPVQIFGTKSSQASRAAERFFKERNIPLQVIDLKQKAMAPGEIKRFSDKFTLRGLLDTESSAYQDSGLKYLKVTDAELLLKIEKDPRLLKLPLVRAQHLVSLGNDPEAWKAMAAL